MKWKNDYFCWIIEERKLHEELHLGKDTWKRMKLKFKWSIEGNSLWRTFQLRSSQRSIFPRIKIFRGNHSWDQFPMEEGIVAKGQICKLPTLYRPRAVHGRRSFHLRETSLTEPARRKERDKQVGARCGEYLLPRGIAPFQHRSLFPFHTSSFPLGVVFLSRFLPESSYKSSRAERASYGNLSLAVW